MGRTPRAPSSSACVSSAPTPAWSVSARSARSRPPRPPPASSRRTSNNFFFSVCFSPGLLWPGEERVEKIFLFLPGGGGGGGGSSSFALSFSLSSFRVVGNFFLSTVDRKGGEGVGRDAAVGEGCAIL